MAKPPASSDDRAFGPNGVEDMITLDNLTEETMLRNIQIRYNKNLIYTFTGSILVSMNPYQLLPIYTPDVVKKYIGQRLGLQPPHIFATADDAYRLMRDTTKNQSVIISGESGAGKTEATKLILQYLAAMTNKRSEIEQMILQSSPILEAFGNAKTVRNNNSSRFGKLIEIGFDTNGYICGAKITQYLLERTRIVQQAATERNYHIFYQFLAGATDHEKSRYKLGDPKNFRYVNQSGCTSIEGVDDEALYNKTKNAMQYLGISEGTQDTLFAVLASVLHIGNIEFAAAGDGSKVKNEDVLAISAGLLGIDSASLGKCLTTRSITVRGTTTSINLNVQQATDARDAFAKAVYARLFEWLVLRINAAVNKPGIKSFIAVLDIFGFENFKKNSFEQLCINYTNEKLQLHFNEHIFKIEQEEYAREKINWSRVDFKDNLECINLIEKTTPPGLLSLLDEETKFPKATDQTFLEKITAQHGAGKSAYFERAKTMRTAFAVKHYAGDVAYEVDGFLEKNRDTLQADLLALVMASKTKLVQEIFATMSSSDAAEGAKKVVTVGGNFKNQLIALITTLSATNTHYVRCIKPNTLQKPSLFDSDLVLAQLRYAGMLETVRIRKSGYPVRFTLKDFVRRYAICVSGLGKYKDDREHASAVLQGLSMDKTTWQLGLTKVFLRDYQYAALEDKRNERIKKQIVKIQSWWRMMQVRLFYLQVKGAAIIVQSWTKRYLYRKRFLRLRSFTVTAQSVTRFVCVYKKQQVRLNSKREEIRRRIAEQKKREADEAEKRAKEAAKAEAERAKAEEKRRKEEEKQAEKDAKKGGKAPPPSGGAFVLDPLGAPPMGDAPPPPPGIMTASPGGPIGAAASAPAKQGGTMLEFAKAANKDKWKPFREVDGLQDPPSIVTEENIVAFPFMEYANKYFRKPNQQPKKAGTLHTMKSALEGTLKRKGGTGVGLSFNEMISYQKKPIDFSLLNLDARLSKLAVDVFTNITNYMHPPEKKAPEPMTLVVPIIRAGLQNEPLRDEIYCQLYKQTFVVQFQKPPPKEVVMRGWELIMYITGSFLPSEELTKYFAAYLLGSRNLEGLRDIASFCLRRLERAWLRYSYRGIYRAHPASTAELNAVRQRAPIVASVFLADGSQKYDMELDSAASANECVSMLARRINLQDPSFFAVYETYTQETPQGRNTIERSLFVEEIVADIMGKASFITNFQFKLVFKRKTYINPRQIPEDPVERNLLYIQACEELANDLLHCADSDAIKLVALRCQAELGNYTAPSMYTAKVLEQYMPKSLMKKRGAEALRGLIAVEHELTNGTSKDEAKLQYIQYASQLLFYGSTLFPVDNNDDKTMPPKIDVMVNVEGLHFVKTEDDKKKVVQSFWFTDITVQYSIDGVTIITENKGTKEFKTKRGPEIYNLFCDYYFWLNAQSEWCRAKEDYAVDDAALLQLKKGDIVHIIEKEDPEWYVGETLDRTRRGSFPSKAVVMLLKPPVELQAKLDSKPKPKMPRASMMVADANKRRVSAMVRASVRYDDRGSSRLSSRNSTDPRASSQMLMNAAKGKQPDNAKAKWSNIAVEPNSFKWETFVSQNFRKSFDRTKKLKGGQMEVAAFSKDPIKETLLEIDATLVKLSLEMFKSVMKYMDDLPKAKASDLEMVQFISANIIQNPGLKDELFSGVIKQIHANPKLESLGKGWGLLAVLCGSFFPTDRLFPYLVAFCIENTKQGGLYTEIANLAKDCLELLARQKQNLNYQRQLPPSRQELDAVTGGAQLACLIYFEDKTSKTIDIDSVSTAQEVVDQLGDLRKLRGWYMFEVIRAENLYTEHILKPETAICDVMSKWDKFTIPKGVEGDVDFQFVFKKYVFLKIDQNAEFSHAAAANLFFYQLVNGVLRGRTPVTEEEAVYLAGLQLQYEFSDYDGGRKLEDIIANYLPRYFAKEQLKKNETQQGKFDKSATIKGGTLSAVAQKVKVVWANFQGMDKKAVLRQYTSKLQENPLYGAMLFPVLYAITRKNIKQCLLAVNEDGISIWEPGTKAPLKKMAFGDISSYGPKKGNISLTHGSLVDPVIDNFQTDESFEIADVIKSYQTASKSVAITVRKALF